MGAVHGLWGGYTDQIVGNIHGQVRLALCYRVMFRPGTFLKYGNSPILKDLSRGSPLSYYNIWQDAKNSWHAAKVPHLTQPGPDQTHDSTSIKYLTSVLTIGPEKAVFVDY